MALITCPECGREVSDKAAACPYCGNPLKENPETEMLNLYQKGNINDFAIKRMVKLVVIEKQFIKEVLKTKQTIPYRIDVVDLQAK